MQSNMSLFIYHKGIQERAIMGNAQLILDLSFLLILQLIINHKSIAINEEDINQL